MSFHDAMSRLARGARRPRCGCSRRRSPIPSRRRAGRCPNWTTRSNSWATPMTIAAIMRTAIAGFYIDRLTGCREALSRVVRDGREGGAVGSAMMALSMIAFERAQRRPLGRGARSSPPSPPPCGRSADTGCMHGPAATPWRSSPATAGTARRVETSVRRWSSGRRRASWDTSTTARTTRSPRPRSAPATSRRATPRRRRSARRARSAPTRPQALWAALDLDRRGGAHRTRRRGPGSRRRDAAADLGRLSPRFALRHRRRRRDGRARRRGTGAVRVRPSPLPGSRGVAVRARPRATRVRRTTAATPSHA